MQLPVKNYETRITIFFFHLKHISFTFIQRKSHFSLTSRFSGSAIARKPSRIRRLRDM